MITGKNYPNEVQQRDGFHISFNYAHTAYYGCETTAVCVDNGPFYILNGDHRVELAALDWMECLTYLHDHALELNRFSECIPAVSSTLADAAAARPSKIYCAR